MIKYDTVVVYKDGVGLNNFELLREDIIVYPNPTSNKLSFTYNKNLNAAFNLSLTNLLGQVLYTRNDFKLEDEIDISFLPKGVYYLKLECENCGKLLKVLKE
jgi:hypothetical protein